MRLPFRTFALSRWLLLAVAFVLFSAPTSRNLEITGGCKMDFINQQRDPGYEEYFTKELESAGANAKWTSCKRTVQEQRDACHDICKAECCPNRCACPGRSNHQKVSTADVGGLKGDVRAGCEFLYKVCQNMRSKNSGLGCEIGGYGSGAHHLAVGQGIKNTAYNQCSFLKPKMGATPPNNQDLKNQGDDMFKQIMGGGAPPASGGGSPSQSPKMTDPAAQYPSDKRAGGQSRIPPDDEPGHNPTTISPDGKVAKNGPPQNNPASNITRGPNGGFTSDGSGDSGGGGKKDGGGFSSAGGSYGGGSHGGGGGAGGFGSDTSGGAAGGGASGKKDANELLASFSGGNKFLGGGKSPQNMSGSETDAAVKNLVNEFAQEVERAPASQNADGIGAEEGTSLFERCHSTYQRALLGGRLTTK